MYKSLAGTDHDGITKYQLKVRVNFKILQYHEIKREERPNKTSQEPATSYFEDEKCEHSTLICKRTETASLEIRKVVP